MLTDAHLAALGVPLAARERFLPALNELLPRYGIASRLRLAHFLAQVLHESGRLRQTEENLNYSASRLVAVFPRHFRPRAAADPALYAGRPERIGARVYANRMGNGDEASGDGYRYRGRGLIQLTGKSNYQAFSDWLGEDVVSAPERVSGELAAHSAVYYWDANRLNAIADRDDLLTLTKRVNGGTHGLDDRRKLLHRAKVVLAALPSAVPGVKKSPEPRP